MTDRASWRTLRPNPDSVKARSGGDTSLNPVDDAFVRIVTLVETAFVFPDVADRVGASDARISARSRVWSRLQPKARLRGGVVSD